METKPSEEHGRCANCLMCRMDTVHDALVRAQDELQTAQVELWELRRLAEQMLVQRHAEVART